MGRQWRAEGKGTQEDCSAMWLTASGFMVMGSVSGLSVVNCSHSEPFQRWIPERKILRGWSDMWSVPSLSFLTFPQFFWLVLVSSPFLYHDFPWKITCEGRFKREGHMYTYG